MAMQMYIIALKGGFTQDASRDVQRFVVQNGGLILMVTRTGPLVLLDGSKAALVGRHPQVGFMGPVTLNPRGFAADRLQRIFAENLSKQLVVENLGHAEPTR